MTRCTGRTRGVRRKAAGGPLPHPYEPRRSSLPGEPGRDYPLHWDPAASAFSCAGRVPGAFYADPSLGCQVPPFRTLLCPCQAYHVCTARRRSLARASFLCPNGTIFSQKRLVCDWW
jgi:hypothetical protein